MDKDEVGTLLCDKGLRLTRQRVDLARRLFSGVARHVCAEQLYAEALSVGTPMSLATIYNTLHQFTKVGLLRPIGVETSKVYFDTDTSDHHHLFIQDEDTLLDIPEGSVMVNGLPSVPEGMELLSIDIIVRVKRTG